MLAKNSVSDIEKREKKVLEKKLGEMEDELKVSDSLKNGIAIQKKSSLFFIRFGYNGVFLVEKYAGSEKLALSEGIAKIETFLAFE